MDNSTVIGRATFIRGRVSGNGDIEIAGRVEGDVTCSGEVLVDAGGLVAANVSAARVVVRGAVKGDLTAEEAIIIESGARIVGNLSAPRIAIVQGALVRGHVQTASTNAARPRASAARATTHVPSRATAPSTENKPRSVTAQAASPRAVPVAAVTSKAPSPPPAKVQLTAVSNHKVEPRVVPQRSGPPAPVVPVLKKGTKAIQKKRG